MPIWAFSYFVGWDVLHPLIHQMEMDNFLGRCLDDKYSVESLIASGGMGEIYLARQKGTGRLVAIKKLKPELYNDHVAVQRFITEAHLYGKVTHPNAVKLYDVLTVDGQLCIVMEYVKGKTLSHYVKSGYVFSTRQIIDIGIQIADALASFHLEGFIHRDLKPDNVMLIETVPGRFSVKILDFGIAKLKAGRLQTLTQNGMIVGTPEFMSPEQCYGQPIDSRVDIYSFGILLFVIICGHLPFEASNALAVLHKQATEPLPEMKRPDQSKIPPGLEDLVRKCTMKQADDRYPSFMDVITDLTALQEGRKPCAERASVFRGLNPTKVTNKSENAQDTGGESRLKQWLIFGIVVLLIVITVTIIVYI